ncbi:MAG TPA: hypothetical protein DEP35_15310 [Deltaproteobacteria bacterium]|jgi:hypothetical protein|nr:hypothetical protein [Deltaproteobacteria bacterium]
MTRVHHGRRLGAALAVGLLTALPACGHYGPPLRAQPPPAGSPPGTPEAEVPSLPQKAVSPATRIPTPMDDDSDEWTP